MLAFILRRLLQSIAVLLTVGLVAFSLFRYVGDPINAMVGQDTPMRGARRRCASELGLNDPAPIQFLRFIGNAVAGQVRLSLPHVGAGRPADPGAAAGHARAVVLRRRVRAVRRRADGRLYRPLSQALVEPAAAGRVADRHLAADLRDRHPADPGLRGLAAAGCRPSGAARRSCDRLVDHQFPDRSGLQGADPARRSRSACSSSRCSCGWCARRCWR